MLGRVLRAYPTLVRVGLAEAIAYRAEMLVWMLTMTMPLVSLALWSAVSASAPVGRFTQRDFVVYFLATLVVRQLTGSWIVWELNQDIKNGTLAQRLLKPIHPLYAYSAGNLAAVPMRALLALPIAMVALVAEGHGFLPRDPVVVAIFVVSLVGAWLITFFTMALVGALGFFLESSTSVFDAWFAGFVLLSGYVVPLSLFPPWVRALASVLPFRYTLAFPVEAIIGMLDRRAALENLAVQWFFVALSAVGALALFRRGVRKWQAFGG